MHASQCVAEGVLHPPRPPFALSDRADHHCPMLHVQTQPTIGTILKYLHVYLRNKTIKYKKSWEDLYTASSMKVASTFSCNLLHLCKSTTQKEPISLSGHVIRKLHHFHIKIRRKQVG